MILKYRMHLYKYRLSEIIVVKNNLSLHVDDLHDFIICIHVCLLRRDIPIQILAAHFEN